MSLPEIHVDKSRKKGPFVKFLDRVEKYGNKLPDVLTLFLLIIIAVLLLSSIAASLGWSTVNPTTNEKIVAVNLLSSEGIIKILTEMVTNFTSFPPLGLVLSVMLGVGIAETTGLISAAMKKTVLLSPKPLILPIIVLVSLLGHVAADAAFIVMPPIAAMVFIMIGRHPIAGLAAAYAAVAGGFSANLLLSVVDVLLASFTETGAKFIDPNFVANPAMNYYFMAASTIMLIPLTVYVTSKIVEPRLGSYSGSVEIQAEIEDITKEEKRGLLWAGIALLICVVILLILTLPSGAFLRDPKTDSLLVSPLMKGLVPIMLFLFLIPSIAYGVGAKVIRSDKDIAEHLTKSMSGMGYYIVLAFVAAQMIAYFNWSNLGPIVAIKGAEFLKEIGITGLSLLILFILFVAVIDFVIASTSAKWAILAPVFVPMFLILGYSPAFTQAAYRIGDSIVNTITPMMPYFAILLTFAKKYNKDIQIGTLISILLPYTLFYGIFWIGLFAIWYFLGLPLGPGNYIHVQ
ncbi:AbgT family transporter [Peribacillus cavernae]|uniref:AbgT family transporter n=1 Tax=Peribacillus cavernae TaxID=1674310 RepID=A0A433HVY1_9BACI|nr:AbgT family transporter [Peribacillus cavernae]MDQ0220756.1 aminobenzoyl-glutamate transport protein [Peribacillus cavernae]RUQ32456.1 AbgT family transporter [Peribacillus cavernae]